MKPVPANPGAAGLAESAFNLRGRVAFITGGGGMLGFEHGAALAAAGASVVLADILSERAEENARQIEAEFGTPASGCALDITDPAAVERTLGLVLGRFGRIDILVNNAANNPKVEPGRAPAWSRLENFPLDAWNADIAVGLTGAFLCSRVFGAEMARRGAGVILNVASDLGVIAPDQRIYRVPGLPEDQQPVKPVTYSVVKTGLIGLTRYLATYWATAGIRVNALSPGGVRAGQPDDFVARLAERIPMGRMAARNEYRGAVLFLCSDASSYMTGQNLIMDGGRTCW